MLHPNPQQIRQRMTSIRFTLLGIVFPACLLVLATTQLASAQINEGTAKPPQETKRSQVSQVPDDKPAPRETQPEPSPEDVPQRDLVVRIVKLKDHRLTVRDKDREEQFTVSVAKDAKVTLNRKPAKLSELKPNDFARLTLDPEKPKTATIVAAARVVKDTPPSDQTVDPKRPAPRPRKDTELVDNQGGLGVVVSDSPAEGILILDVHRETPAWDAGIQVGDYLLKVDGKAILTPDEFLALIRKHEPNEAVRLGLWREGKTRQGAVKLTTREAARDREAEDDRALILGETHGDDTVVIKRPPGRTEPLDREPEQRTIIVESETNPPPAEGERRQAISVPEDYDTLVKKYQALHKRLNELERKLKVLQKSR